MKQEIQERWSAALRSDAYEQARGTLHRTRIDLGIDGDNNTVGWCCLGVMCDLAYRDKVVTRKTQEYDDESFDMYGEDNDSAYLPREVSKWAGIDSREVYFDVTHLIGNVIPVVNLTVEHTEMYDDPGRLIVSAVFLNDHYKLSFEQIADLIDAGKIHSDFTMF